MLSYIKFYIYKFPLAFIHKDFTKLFKLSLSKQSLVLANP